MKVVSSIFPHEVLQPYQDYQNRLNEYEKAYIEEVEKQFPLSIETKNELQVFQQILALRNEDIAPILAKYKPSLNIFKNIFYSNFLHYRIRGIDTFIVGGIIGAIVSFIVVTMVRPPYISRSCPVKKEYIVNDRMSVGEEILLTQDTNADKQAGVKAFTNGDCQTAIQKFESYRTANPTDPEALIYLNNAKAIRRGDPLKIAVSVPIGTNQGVAKEMLRGVAQAQDEVNFNGGINGKLLKVAIANDNNDPSEAVQIAKRVGEDTNILAVVGHNSSNASLSAAPVYQQYGLVMMTPTSYAPNLSNVGNYIFRTAPSSLSKIN
ncbi:MAG: ABC transporter substrate-binding protein [Nostoc sp. LLA-1]|nr:ABC transporter substrate-binding protein [Cyanocohniella sp. LLY]